MLSNLRRLLAVLILFAGAAAAQPSNDNWAAREAIVALPTTDVVNVAAATVESLDPAYFCKLGGFDAGARSVWYAFTTGGQDAYVNLAASGYNTLLAVYRGNPAEGFVQVAGGCNDNGGTVGGSAIRGLRLDAGVEYSIVVSAFDATVSGTLTFLIEAARVYTVTVAVDGNDGTCDLHCTVRDAIDASNLDPGAVLIPPGTYTLTLPPAGENGNVGGDLDLLQAVGIYGLGPTPSILDGNGVDRLLHVDPTAAGARTFIVGDVTLRNGSSGAADGGGAVAAIEDDDYVHFERVRVLDNASPLDGGGLRLDGHAWLVDSTVDDNQASGSGGGGAFGSPFGLSRRVLIERSTFSNNRALSVTGGGGGLFAPGALVQVSNSTISGNRANLHGGGALFTDVGVVVTTDSTVARNVADADGNGTGNGGGLRDASAPNLLVVVNSVLGDNTRGAGGGVADDCSAVPAGPWSTGFNLVEAPGDCQFSGTDDVTGIDPLLGPLADNTGLTLTHLPLIGSPVIDSGSKFTYVQQDQRGKPRPADGDGNGEATFDRGAVELDTQPATLIFSHGFEN